MPPLFYTVLIMAALTVMGFGVFLFQLTRGGALDGVQERLQHIKSPGKASAREAEEKLTKTLKSLSRLTAPKEKRELTTLQKKLSYAGYRRPNAAVHFFGLKALGSLVFGGAAVVYSLFIAPTILQGLIAVIVGTALGLYGPNLWLKMKTSRRNDALSKALPNALDFLVVCVEAGLGLDMALKRVGTELAATAPVLAMEISLVSLELNSGIPRQRALANLGERNGLDDLRSLSTILVQADKFGTSIAQALRVSSDSIRTKRRQKAEEKATKTTVKLTFPLVLFILPATFIIVIGPSIIKLVQDFLPQLK